MTVRCTKCQRRMNVADGSPIAAWKRLRELGWAPVLIVGDGGAVREVRCPECQP